jgi:hypothetical protein
LKSLCEGHHLVILGRASRVQAHRLLAILGEVGLGEGLMIKRIGSNMIENKFQGGVRRFED